MNLSRTPPGRESACCGFDSVWSRMPPPNTSQACPLTPRGHTGCRPRHRSPSRFAHTAHTGPARTGHMPPCRPLHVDTTSRPLGPPWMGQPLSGSGAGGHRVRSPSAPWQQGRAWGAQAGAQGRSRCPTCGP